MNTIAIVSVSGGKDSAATAQLAIDAHGLDNCRLVMADTGHEHELVIEYVTGYLQDRLGAPITMLRADFSKQIAAKRIYVANKWPAKLMAPKDPDIEPLSAAQADEIVQRSLSVLHPTGIPFLDLCLWKGRFPSQKAQFCTQELKRYPLDAFTLDLMAQGYHVESWRGIRRNESRNRADALDRYTAAEGWEVVHPIASWTADQVFDFL